MSKSDNKPCKCKHCSGINESKCDKKSGHKPEKCNK
jgi:hypothetical protein